MPSGVFRRPSSQSFPRQASESVNSRILVGSLEFYVLGFHYARLCGFQLVHREFRITVHLRPRDFAHGDMFQVLYAMPEAHQSINVEKVPLQSLDLVDIAHRLALVIGVFQGLLGVGGSPIETFRS